MRRLPSLPGLAFLMIALSVPPLALGQQPEDPEPLKPAPRELPAEVASRVETLDEEIDGHRRAGAYEKAAEAAREVAALRTEHQGSDHWQAQDARREAETLSSIHALPEEGRAEFASVMELRDAVIAEYGRARYAEAERHLRTLLDIHRRWLGEDHPWTADCYDNVTTALNEQGKYAEAEPLDRKALAIRLKVLGGDHPDVARSYNSIAVGLYERGKTAEAEPLFRRALAISLKALGVVHTETARNYYNLASNLQAQGKAVEAEPLFRRALAINLKALGEDRADTALCYNYLANNLKAQRRLSEAEPFFRRALEIRLEALEATHPDVVQSLNNLAL
jgi:tetratricopeptide (TPR) repeat protein